MSVRYSGPHADYPVYCCRADKDQAGVSLCQEVRALAVDDGAVFPLDLEAAMALDSAAES